MNSAWHLHCFASHPSSRPAFFFIKFFSHLLLSISHVNPLFYYHFTAMCLPLPNRQWVRTADPFVSSPSCTWPTNWSFQPEPHPLHREPVSLSLTWRGYEKASFAYMAASWPGLKTQVNDCISLQFGPERWLQHSWNRCPEVELTSLERVLEWLWNSNTDVYSEAPALGITWKMDQYYLTNQRDH